MSIFDTTKNVTNKFLFALMGTCFIVSGLQLLMPGNSQHALIIPAVTGLVLYYSFVKQDRLELLKAGYDNQRVPSQAWFLLPLVYLIKRCRLTGMKTGRVTGIYVAAIIFTTVIVQINENRVGNQDAYSSYSSNNSTQQVTANDEWVEQPTANIRTQVCQAISAYMKDSNISCLRVTNLSVTDTNGDKTLYRAVAMMSSGGEDSFSIEDSPNSIYVEYID